MCKKVCDCVIAVKKLSVGSGEEDYAAADMKLGPLKPTGSECLLLKT